jgi:hypothetical protein
MCVHPDPIPINQFRLTGCALIAPLFVYPHLFSTLPAKSAYLTRSFISQFYRRMGNCISAGSVEVSDEDKRKHKEAEKSMKEVRIQFPVFFPCIYVDINRLY